MSREPTDNRQRPSSSSKKVHLSKSRIQAGAQCPLRLWTLCTQPELAPPPKESLQFIFDRGRAIGELARERHPRGKLIDADYRDSEEALAQTRKALCNPSLRALFEPAFRHRDVLARIDLLVRCDENVWDLIEVKSATKPKATYLRDVAIQYWVLHGAGILLRKAGVLLLNTNYVYDGHQLDLQQLFSFADLTSAVCELQGEIGEEIAACQVMLRQKEPPDIGPGLHCHTPYACPYYGHCTKNVVFPKYPVSTIPRLPGEKRAQLAAMGIEEVHDIPEDFPLKPSQSRVRTCIKDQCDWASDELALALGTIDYPVYHLDFEALMPAVPRYAKTSPYQNIPFQYSIHREERCGGTTHLEYLCTHRGDPRRELAERLISDLEKTGSICVYSSYESGVITRLAEQLPDLAKPLLALTDRLWDLLPIIRKHYYHPHFRGSFSIKRVLPAVVPELSYEEMEIGDGMAAAFTFEKTIEMKDEAERQRIFENLRCYCGQDTFAMLRLRQELAKRAS